MGIDTPWGVTILAINHRITKLKIVYRIIVIKVRAYSGLRPEQTQTFIHKHFTAILCFKYDRSYP